MTASGESTVRNMKEIFVPHLKLSMEIGLVEYVVEFVEIYQNVAERTGCSELILAFTQAREWIENAEIYEQKHGRGSMINRDHPRCPTFQKAA